MLNRPVGKTASEFYDMLLRRGMHAGMTRAEVDALASEAEWARYTLSCRIGLEMAGVMREMHDGPEPLTFSALATDTWDDVVARDERENPPRDRISAGNE